MNILGIDICKNRAVCWMVSCLPRNPKQFWKQAIKDDARSKDPQVDSLTFYFNRGGIEQLFSLNPDAIALEPTGMHYSTLVSEVAARAGIKVLWVGHVQAANYRKQQKLPDKNDLADAFALGCYGLLYHEQPNYFIEFQPYPITRIRELYLQLKSLNRFQGPLINRIKQQLSHEFPEAMDAQMNPKSDGRRALICWLAHRERKTRKHAYWDNRYRDSVSPLYEIEISEFTRELAAHIDDYDLWNLKLEAELKKLVYHPLFDSYNRVFDEFEFNLALRAILLVLIYPFERFDDIGAFKRRVGSAKLEDSSGDKANWKTGSGSKLARCELYIWVVTRIAKKGKANSRPSSPIGKQICEFYDGWQEKYQSSPAQYHEELVAKTQSKMVDQLRSLVSGELDGIVTPDAIANLMTQISALKDSLKTTQNKSNPIERGKFGKLIVGKTLGYTVRWLYRRLKFQLNR